MPENTQQKGTEALHFMDEAAIKAAAEFDATWSAAQVATWWKKWYLQAGHKRLGRILIRVAE